MDFTIQQIKFLLMLLDNNLRGDPYYRGDDIKEKLEIQLNKLQKRSSYQ